MKTSDVLNKAADLIEERGWQNADHSVGDDPWGGGADGSTPLCLEGGILAALGLSTGKELIPPIGFTRCASYRAVADHLYGDPARMVFTWNDAPGRTAAEVIEVLRACALIEAAREEQDAAWETYAAVVSA
jgi:hypothetical protein